jgi:hypothetical protein
MSRSGYGDDGDYYNLYRGTVDRALAGKRGQAFLRDMLAAMNAMPEKRLIAYGFEIAGEVCAIGTVTKARGIDMSDIDVDDHDYVGYVAAMRLDIAESMAREIMYINDDAHDRSDETPEQRFTRVRAWAESRIK